MVLVTGNWKIWLAGMAASLIIFGVVFFAVIQPDQNTANQAVKSGLQQTQQALNQAQKQFKHAAGSAGAAGTAGQAQLSKAAKLTACIAKAGTDPSKLQSCQTKYAG
jgi:hypothetical protein